MSFFTSAKAKFAASKLAEEQLYAEAASEVASGKIRQGLWAKAIAETDGNEAAAKARYLKLRVETMKAEADVMDYAFEQAREDMGEDGANKNEDTPIWWLIFPITFVVIPTIYALLSSSPMFR